MTYRIAAMALMCGVFIAAGCAKRSAVPEVPRLSEMPELAVEAADGDQAVALALTANMVSQQPQKRGFLGLFGIGAKPAAAPPTPAAPQETGQPAPAPERRGLLSRIFAGSSSSKATPSTSSRRGPRDGSVDVDAGSTLKMGQVGRVCGLSRSQRGSRVEAQAGFTLYDSFPKSTAPRPFYITGFADGCARQVTGAMVMFGHPSVHERYQYTTRGARYAAFDTQYERLKSSICGVGRGEPCGAKIDRLQRSVALITAYPSFGTNDEWTKILLHGRKLVAVSVAR